LKRYLFVETLLRKEIVLNKAVNHRGHREKNEEHLRIIYKLKSTSCSVHTSFFNSVFSLRSAYFWLWLIFDNKDSLKQEVKDVS